VILLLETVHPDAHRLLETVGDPVVLSETHVLDADRCSGKVRAIVTRGLGQVPATAFGRLGCLEVVGRCGAGLDNVDTDAAAHAGVVVVHAPGVTSHAVAEHALMLMLALARRVTEVDRSVRAGNWEVRNGFEGVELRRKRLGVVGLGATGSRIAEFGSALGMDVVGTVRGSPKSDMARLSLEELLRTSDVVQLCVPLTDETRDLIGPRQFGAMKPGALLINTARGALVNLEALANALDQGQIGGYAADVWEPEPPLQTEKLIAHNRILVTPHVAALTDVTYREICMRTAAAVVAVLSGQEPDRQCVYRG